MAMSRKDYKAIAECINCSLDYYSDRRINTSNLLATLCDYFKESNPNFQQGVFIEACLKEEGE